MTQSAAIFRPVPAGGAALRIAVLVLPHSAILTVAATLDPLRSANRHLGHAAFDWRVVSPSGAAVPLTCGLELPSAGGLEAAEDADALIVIAGFRQAEVATRPLIGGLRRIAQGLALVGGIDAGPWVLARAGLLDGHRATVHWEDLEDFAAAFPAVDVVPDRFVVSGARATAGGAAPAADLMLELIRARHGPALARQVAASFIYDARRDGREPQVAAGRTTGDRDSRVAGAVALMERHLEAPLPVARIAARLGVSVRRLEGLFRESFGTGPGAHYLDMRLQTARRLVTDTRHPLQTVALRCGFASQSSLSRAFRRRFGTPPGALRRRPPVAPGGAAPGPSADGPAERAPPRG